LKKEAEVAYKEHKTSKLSKEMTNIIKVKHANEMRRISAESARGCTTNFNSFVAIVETLFPKLAGQEIALFWRDEEGDEIIVNSDVEFQEALRFMTSSGQMLRFEARIVSSEVPTAQASTVVHAFVTCDECGMSPIKGIRYKCTVRNDFDLCTNCEAKKQQPYPVIKIFEPVHPPGLFNGRRWGGGCGESAAGQEHWRRGGGRPPFHSRCPAMNPAAACGSQGSDHVRGGRPHWGRHFGNQLGKTLQETVAPFVQAFDQAMSGLDQPVPAVPVDEDARITLKVRDQAGAEILFKVKQSTEMGKIFEAYAERVSIPAEQLRFFRDGVTIKKSDTPKLLGLSDNDQMEVMQKEQTVSLEEQLLSAALEESLSMTTSVVSEVPKQPLSTASAAAVESDDWDVVRSGSPLLPVAPAAVVAEPVTVPVPEAAAVVAESSADLAPAPAPASAAVNPLQLLWHRELQLLADMGFTDVDTSLPLLQRHLVTPLALSGDRSAAPSVDGMQRVVSSLLGM